MTTWIIIGIIVVLAFLLISTYNRLVSLRNGLFATRPPIEKRIEILENF